MMFKVILEHHNRIVGNRTADESTHNFRNSIIVMKGITQWARNFVPIKLTINSILTRRFPSQIQFSCRFNIIKLAERHIVGRTFNHIGLLFNFN